MGKGRAPARDLPPLTEEQKQIVEQWIPFAQLYAKKFVERWPQRFAHDLESAAFWGLVKAAGMWRPEMKFSFGSYAGTVIYRVLDRFVMMEIKRAPRPTEKLPELKADTRPHGYDDIEAEDFFLYVTRDLDPYAKDVLHQHVFEGKTYTEVATDRGVSQQAVNQKMRLARKRLLELVDEGRLRLDVLNG